jgi:mono/diheme cytochrome c family protein
MAKKLPPFIFLLSISFIFIWSCKHEPEELAGPTPIEPQPCDTLNISYQSDVYPIFNQYCIYCHGGTAPEGGIVLTDYEVVADLAQNGQLLGSVNHQAGYSPMPKDADKLSFCLIRTITIWVNDTTFPPGGDPCDPDTIYFERDLLPLLQSSCAQPGCHDAITMQDGVRLTDYNSVMQTADVDPFDPESSKIYKVVIEVDPEDRMPPPPASAWPQGNIDILYTWIAQGAQNLFCDEEDCDTTAVTYAAPVSGIIQKHCLGCHSDNNPLGGLSLQGYDNVVATAVDGRLMGTVKHEAGYPAMPKNSSKLSDCKILLLETWIQNGIPQ